MRSDDEDLDTLRRAHREASDQLGDGPDAGVRAAVLAAAARGVDARPQLASTSSTAASEHRPFRSRRWPMSAAVLLVVSVMTGLVATQVMRDGPEHVTTIASSQPAKPEAAARKPAVAEPPSVASADTDTRAAPPAVAPAALPPAPSQAKRAIARNESRVGTAPETTERAAESAPAVATPSPSRSPFVAAPPAAPAPPPQEALAKAETSADAVSRAADARTAPGAARAGPSSSPDATTAMRARIGRVAEPATPEAWIERIVKLRADGDDAEADRELDALRRRYPGFIIPAKALATGGTR